MKKIGSTVIIEEGPDGPCQLCGQKAELRPYGPGGKWICFACGNKDKKARATRKAAFDAIYNGPGEKPQ